VPSLSFSVCLSVCLSVFLSDCLSVCLSFSLTVCLSFSPSVYLSLSFCSVCLRIRVSCNLSRLLWISVFHALLFYLPPVHHQSSEISLVLFQVVLHPSQLSPGVQRAETDQRGHPGGERHRREPGFQECLDPGGSLINLFFLSLTKGPNKLMFGPAKVLSRLFNAKSLYCTLLYSLL
jgi:hypothetical protein